MRQIKFRAKRLDGGQWAYGDFITHPNGGVEIHHEYKSHLVDPETVGQFTGLQDREGVDIYEGDVVQQGKYKMLIVWRKDLASFALRKKGWAYDHYFGEAADAGQCEVIGSIHDNPTLI